MTTSMWMIAGVIGTLVAAPACGGGGSGDDAPPTDAPPGTIDANEHVETVTVAVGGPVPLDVLLVIDNSGSMLPYQQQLGRSMQDLTDALSTGGVLPDLHVGVVSSDLGSLGASIDPNCASSDEGELQTNFCAGIAPDTFLEDRLNEATGTRIRNYSGSLASAVGCMVNLGSQGCGFEMHLEAMRLALMQPGFLRDEADLAVLVLGDEDDCSAYNPDFFGPDSAALGPIDSFRCFEFGVECTPDDPRAVGVKSACVSREDSDYLHPMSRYVDFLHQLKPAPTQITVGLIVGDVAPVEVGRRTPTGSTTPRPDLLPSCTFTTVGGIELTADPAVRLRQFLDGFPGRNTMSTICDDEYAGLTELGTLAHRAALGNACFVDAVLDTVPGDPLDADCDVRLVFPGLPDADVPACDAGATNRPCWRIAVDASCPTAAQHAVVIETAATEPPQGTRAVASCRVQ